MTILRWNDVIKLPWEDKYEPLLMQLNAIFQRPDEPHLLRCAARALLLLSKEGQEPIVADVLRRVREEDSTSPRGGRFGYDEAKWFDFILQAVNALRSDDPSEALRL